MKKGKKKGKATGGGESDGSPRSGEFVVTRGMIWMMSGEPASRIKKDFIAAIKQIKTGPESTDQDRIVFIGCKGSSRCCGIHMRSNSALTKVSQYCPNGLLTGELGKARDCCC